MAWVEWTIEAVRPKSLRSPRVAKGEAGRRGIDTRRQNIELSKGGGNPAFLVGQTI